MPLTPSGEMGRGGHHSLHSLLVSAAAGRWKVGQAWLSSWKHLTQSPAQVRCCPPSCLFMSIVSLSLTLPETTLCGAN